MSGGGFLREVLQGSSSAAGGGSGGSSGTVVSNAHRLSARNSQAVKVILSESYLRWCSEPDTLGILETLARELLAAAKAPPIRGPGSSTPPPQGQPVSSPTMPPSSMTSVEMPRYADPLQQQGGAIEAERQGQEAQRSTSPSPPPSPPMRQRQRKDVDERRTPSPVQHSTRFLGVDELDTMHRVTSPGAASPVSPTTMHGGQLAIPSAAAHSAAVVGGGAQSALSQQQQKHQVDPHIPLGSSPGNHHVLDTAALFEKETSPVNGGRGSSPVEHAHKYALSTSNAFAVQPASQLPMASVREVPTFYTKSEPEGICEVKMDELDALTAFFSSKPTSIIKPPGGAAARGGRGSGPGGSSSSVDIDVNKTIRKIQFGKLCKDVFGIPVWLKDCLYRKIALANGLSEHQPLNYHFLKKFYDSFGRLSPNRRLFELLRQNPRSNVLTMDDLKVGVKFLVETHPGLEFLKQPEFQDSYCRTVAIRIVFELEIRHQRNVQWSRFDRSDLPTVMRELDDTSDINHVLRYFSYEHFYVLYCRFWELDSDRDQLIGLSEMLQYSQGALTQSVIQRVVQGAGRKLTSGVPGKLDFEDFVYFCLSEEDKNHAQAVYYWFKVLDLDADGILSGYELGKFFEENRPRFVESVGEELRYDDMLCQMLDMVGANKIREHPCGLTLADLRSCEAPANFFNMLFNATKFLNFEHRDPFAEHQQKLLPEKTEWDRFARLEYDRMANEVA